MAFDFFHVTFCTSRHKPLKPNRAHCRCIPLSSPRAAAIRHALLTISCLASLSGHPSLVSDSTRPCLPRRPDSISRAGSCLVAPTPPGGARSAPPRPSPAAPPGSSYAPRFLGLQHLDPHVQGGNVWWRREIHLSLSLVRVRRGGPFLVRYRTWHRGCGRYRQRGED